MESNTKDKENVMPEEIFISFGTVYTKTEEDRARAIRAMPDGGEKNYFIRCFVIGTGKIFPKEKPIEICINFDTAFLNSSNRKEAHVIMNTRSARQRLVL